MDEMSQAQRADRRRAAARLHREAAAVDHEAAEWKDLSTRSDDWRSLRTICQAVFGRNNLGFSSFEDVSAVEIERRFVQGRKGVRITFTVSNHALEKIALRELHDAIDALVVPLREPGQEGDHEA